MKVKRVASTRRTRMICRVRDEIGGKEEFGER